MCRKPKCDESTKRIILFTVCLTIMGNAIFHGLMFNHYQLAIDTFCPLPPMIPNEFVERNCSIVSDDSVLGYMLKLDNVCNQTEYHITATSIPNITLNSELKFLCYYNTTYCGQNTNSSDQITRRFFDETNTYNRCFSDRQAHIDNIRDQWIIIGIAVILFAWPMLAVVLVLLAYIFLCDCKCKRKRNQGQGIPPIVVGLPIPIVDVYESSSEYESEPPPSDDGFGTASSDIDKDDMCGICLEKLTEKNSVVLKCCNYVVHNNCMQQFLMKKRHRDWKCINPYCNQKISRVPPPDDPTCCPMCNIWIDDNSTAMFTGCCQKNVHQACYYSTYAYGCHLCTGNGQ